VKVRFAISPHAGTSSAGELLAFAESVQRSGFDGIWLSDLPIAPVLDPLLGLALVAGRTTRLRLVLHPASSLSDRSVIRVF
jgi:alkanesulfonate monooxygenase SsuD/methylene tetrahydromethanopterin reductase-like flavin-dependent oxidoreductase (luciferase family)